MTPIRILLASMCLFWITLHKIHAQLIWPNDELGSTWRRAIASFPGSRFTSVWPKSVAEICRDTSEFINNELVFEELKKLCRTYSKLPFFNLQVNLASHALNKRYPLGDSLDDLSSGNGTALAYKVTPDQGQSWEALPPLLQMELQYPFSQCALVYFRLNVMRIVDAWHNDPFSLNIPTGGVNDVDINEPSLGYFNFNRDFIAVHLGRFPVHWSPSSQYGLTLTSSVPYHDGLMVSLKIPNIRYHYLISSINPWLSGTPTQPGTPFPIGSEEYRQRNPPRDFNSRNRVYDQPLKTMFGHRLEMILGRFEAGITELVMIGGKPPSLRDGNPFIFFHNNYGDGFDNVGLSIDGKVKLPGKFNFFGELFLDEIQEADDGGSPTNLGWMIGAEYNFTWEGVSFFHCFHLTKTDPFLYNYEKPYLTFYSRHVLKSNFIELGSKPFIDTYVIDYPLGYFRGSDALDFWYNIQCRLTEKISADLELGWLQQGEKDAYSLHEKEELSSPSGVTESETRLSFSVHYQFTPRMNTVLGYGFQYLDQLHHHAENEAFRQQVIGRLSWSWK